MIDKEVLSIG